MGKVLFVDPRRRSPFPSVEDGRLRISCRRSSAENKRLFYEHKRLKELPGLPPPPAGGAAQLIGLLDCSQQKAALQRAR